MYFILEKLNEVLKFLSYLQQKKQKKKEKKRKLKSQEINKYFINPYLYTFWFCFHLRSHVLMGRERMTKTEYSWLERLNPKGTIALICAYV